MRYNMDTDRTVRFSTSVCNQIHLTFTKMVKNRLLIFLCLFFLSQKLV